MEEINWVNQYEEVHPDELEKELRDYVKSGFEYIPFNGIYLTPALVKTSDGKIFSQNDIKEILSGKLVFGDRKQLEAIEVLNFFKIAESYY